MNKVSDQLIFFGKAAKNLFLVLMLLTVFLADAQQSRNQSADAGNHQLMVGDWVFNEELSDTATIRWKRRSKTVVER